MPGESEKPDGEDLLTRTRRLVREIAGDTVKRLLDDVLGWALGRAVAYLVAGALLITAAVFLLVGGVRGLEAAGLKPWVSYLILGGAALVSGLIVLRASRPPAR